MGSGGKDSVFEKELRTKGNSKVSVEPREMKKINFIYSDSVKTPKGNKGLNQGNSSSPS